MIHTLEWPSDYVERFAGRRTNEEDVWPLHTLQRPEELVEPLLLPFVRESLPESPFHDAGACRGRS